MIETVTTVLDWFGLCVFAVTGALVASRKEMDIVGFALLGSVTAVGGGTLRDTFLGIRPVFWVQQPAYLVTCIVVSCLVFFIAHVPQSRYRSLVWLDAVGLSLFAVTGAERTLDWGAGPTIAVAMGVATASFGGILRDMLGGERPILLSQEIYVTAALLGAGLFVTLRELGVGHDPALVLGFAAAFALRGAAIHWRLSLRRYRPRPGRTPEEAGRAMRRL